MPVLIRALASALLAGALVWPPPAGAVAPSPAPSVAPTPGKEVCGITDERLAEVSGLVATKDGYVAVPDGKAENGEVLEVYDIDAQCNVVERHVFQRNPYDPEDLAITKDGTLWIADTGDNKLERETVALWRISPDREKADLFRMTYPDGKHDAEALLMQPDSTPVIVTKDLNQGGTSGLYAPAAALKADATVPLKKLGELKLTNTGTPGGPIGAVGQRLVTGAAMSADGTRAVVRTYTDAYEWKVADGKLTAALTKTTPIRTALPGEPVGEAITFSNDGKQYVTASEAAGEGEPARVFSYVPNRPPPAKKPIAATPAAGPGWFSGLTLQDIRLIIAAFGVLGLALLGFGIWGIKRSRRGPAPGPGAGVGPDDDPDGDGRDRTRGVGHQYPPESARGRRRRLEPEEFGEARDRPDRWGPQGPSQRHSVPGHGGEGRRAAGRATVPAHQPPGVGRPSAQARASVPPPDRAGPHPRRRTADEPGYEQPPGGRYW